MRGLPCADNQDGLSTRRAYVRMGCLWLALSAVLLTGLPPAALAIGPLIDAPGRVDMVYDDARDILYITSGESVLRYQVNSNSFLPPFELGGNLKGIDLSPDGNTLIVADQTYSASEVWVHVVEPDTGLIGKASFPRAFNEGGTFTVAFGKDGAVLITSSFLGSGWVPMRRFDPLSYEATDIASVRQDTMLSSSADGSVIGFAESNISDGRFGRYRVADGDLLRKTGYTDGTGWFNYEIGVSNYGIESAIPTYGGTFICDSNLVKYATIGQYAGGQPIGVVYHPTKKIVYFAWATTTRVYAYDTENLVPVAEYDFENTFDHPGNHAFVEGRLKMSRDGRILFATVQGGVRYVKLFNAPPVAHSQSVSTAEDTGISITLMGSDADGDPLTYTALEMPNHGTLSGTAPDLLYTPFPDFNGSDQLTFKVNDGLADSPTGTISVTVVAVNDPPSFTLSGTTITAKRHNGIYTVSGWANNISAGPPDEAMQAVTFLVTHDNPKLFSEPPAIDSAGTLTFATVRGRKGTATVTVRARDNGGISNGGIDQSTRQYFRIEIY